MSSDKRETMCPTERRDTPLYMALFEPKRLMHTLQDQTDRIRRRNDGIWDPSIDKFSVGYVLRFQYDALLTWQLLLRAASSPFVADAYAVGDENPKRAELFIKYMACAIHHVMTGILSVESADLKVEEFVRATQFMYLVGSDEDMGRYIKHTDVADADGIPTMKWTVDMGINE